MSKREDTRTTARPSSPASAMLENFLAFYLFCSEAHFSKKYNDDAVMLTISGINVVDEQLLLLLLMLEADKVSNEFCRFFTVLGKH